MIGSAQLEKSKRKILPGYDFQATRLAAAAACLLRFGIDDRAYEELEHNFGGSHYRGDRLSAGARFAALVLRNRSEDDARRLRAKVHLQCFRMDRSFEDTFRICLRCSALSRGTNPLAQMNRQIKKRRAMEAIKRIVFRESLNHPPMVIFKSEYSMWQLVEGIHAHHGLSFNRPISLRTSSSGRRQRPAKEAYRGTIRAIANLCHPDRSRCPPFDSAAAMRRPQGPQTVAGHDIDSGWERSSPPPAVARRRDLATQRLENNPRSSCPPMPVYTRATATGHCGPRDGAKP